MDHRLESTALIAAMITPALLILASSSLVASALMRMARVVDRTRVLTSIVYERSYDRIGASPALVARFLTNHAQRARQAERSIALLYAAIFVFVATCLAIAVDRVSNGRFAMLPEVLAIMGTLLLMVGAGYMVAESRLSAAQITDEIALALERCRE